MSKNFVATEEQIRLSEAVVVAMALEETIRPIVESYETAILAKHRFRIDPKWIEFGEVADRVILNRKESFLLSETDAKKFFEECFAARDAAGLKVEHPEGCPLLTVENLRIKAENALIKSLSSIPGLEAFATGILPLDKRSKVVELALGLFLPSSQDAESILQRFTSIGNQALAT